MWNIGGGGVYRGEVFFIVNPLIKLQSPVLMLKTLKLIEIPVVRCTYDGIVCPPLRLCSHHYVNSKS